MKGVSTYSSLEQVLTLAGSHEPLSRSDFVVLTGDLSQDESSQSYQHLTELISRFYPDASVFYLPGNHDQNAVMDAVFSESTLEKGDCSINRGNWQFLFLDSTAVGRVEGHLSETELDKLSKFVNAPGEEYLAVFLHHNPVTMDSRRQDRMMLQNDDDFLKLVKANDRVKAVVCGHVHQALVQELDGVQFVASPSTCVQFCPTETGLTIDPKPAGFRELHFYENGDVRTEAYRLERLPEGLKTIEGDL